MSNPIRDLLSSLSLASLYAGTGVATLLLVAATVTALASVDLSSFPIFSPSVFSSLGISAAAAVVLVSSLIHLPETRMSDFRLDCRLLY